VILITDLCKNDREKSWGEYEWAERKIEIKINSKKKLFLLKSIMLLFSQMQMY